MTTNVSLMAGNGGYLAAEQRPGSPMVANRDGVGTWENFRLFNDTHPGDTPRHGDAVVLQTWTGKFVTAPGGGGGVLHGGQDWVDDSTRFTLERTRGPGVVVSGDQVSLRAASRHYVVAEDNGGGTVNANRTHKGPWETFTLKMYHPQLVRLLSATRHFVTAEGGGGGQVTANRADVGLWETFSLLNLSRPDRSIGNGDSIGLQAWDGRFVRVADRGSVDCRANRATGGAVFRVVAAGTAPITDGRQLTLQSLATSGFLTSRAGVLATAPAATPAARFTLQFAEERAIPFGWVPDGASIPNRPFASVPDAVRGQRRLLLLYYHNNLAPRIAVPPRVMSRAVFGEAPSLAAWLQAMSAGTFRAVNAGTFGSIPIPDGTPGDPDPGMSAILTAAEDSSVPLRTFSPGGVFDTDRTTLVEVSAFAVGGQNRGRSGVSRRGIRFDGGVPWVGVSPDLNSTSRMVLCHELSHALLGVVDKYGQRRPLRGDVVADRLTVDARASFVIERVSGPGSITANDQIRLRTSEDRFVTAANSPTTSPALRHMVNTEGAEAGAAREFTIIGYGPTAGIRTGSTIALRSRSGLFVSAQLGGNSAVTANAGRVGAWERFEIAKADAATGTEPSITSGDVVTLRTTDDFFVAADTDRRDVDVSDADSRRGYVWGAGSGQSGDFDNASANYSPVMLSLWDRLRLGWVRPRYLTPENRGAYTVRPFLDARDALILFDPQRPTEWYTLENRQARDNVDEVPSSGVVISWICQDEGYWRWWFNNANDSDHQVQSALYPALISAAASTALPPNAMARPVVLNPDIIHRRNAPDAAFTDQEVVLPLGNGDPSRFHLSFHPSSTGIGLCIR